MMAEPYASDDAHWQEIKAARDHLLSLDDRQLETLVRRIDEDPKEQTHFIYLIYRLFEFKQYLRAANICSMMIFNQNLLSFTYANVHLVMSYLDGKDDVAMEYYEAMEHLEEAQFWLDEACADERDSASPEVTRLQYQIRLKRQRRGLEDEDEDEDESETDGDDEEDESESDSDEGDDEDEDGEVDQDTSFDAIAAVERIVGGDRDYIQELTAMQKDAVIAAFADRFELSQAPAPAPGSAPATGGSDHPSNS